MRGENARGKVEGCGCCNQEGCRKRVTPPSVRFLGRKVYFAAVIILVAAMRQGPTPRRVQELRRLFGDLDARTIARWRRSRVAVPL